MFDSVFDSVSASVCATIVVMFNLTVLVHVLVSLSFLITKVLARIGFVVLNIMDGNSPSYYESTYADDSLAAFMAVLMLVLVYVIGDFAFVLLTTIYKAVFGA